MQVYSLAGITISLNLVIDNTIVMTDHIRRRQNLEAFVSVLAATLTTIGALVIIFFLDDKLRLDLQDFAAVVLLIVLLLEIAVLLPLTVALSGISTVDFNLSGLEFLRDDKLSFRKKLHVLVDGFISNNII